MTHAEDLQLARRVHYSFLPDDYQDDLLDVSVKMLPHEELGGDYCSVFPIHDDRVVVCMCDAVGHGLASALFAARINTFVLAHSLVSRCPCSLIENMNAFFCRHMPETTMYSSFFSMQIEKGSGLLTFAGAGHPPVAWYDSQRDRVEFLESITTPVGIQDPLAVTCRPDTRQLHSGDRLLMYTDGLTEGRNPQGRQFGTADLSQVLASNRDHDSATVNGQLIQALTEFTEGGLHDDVLSMLISIRRGAAR